ncbi:MAG: TIGR03663 family protein [Anaerolineae bacterium]|nr:TIGR03663 family protein [Anaerolineae bacterium]
MFESTDDRTRALPRLTIEIALYIALVCVALFARVVALGDVPLTSDEARQAIASWNFINGREDAFIGSPLLFTGNAILFALFGANDTLARLLPALFGSALVLLPALVRRELGRIGALVSSTLLAFSPSLIFFSRALDGSMIAVTCALAAFAFAWRYLAERNARELHLAAIFAALALTAAREVWTIVFALAIFAVLSFKFQVSGSHLTQYVTRNTQHTILFFVLTILLTATTFTLRREGIGAAFDLLSAWLAGLQPSSAFYDPLRLLLIYDPLVFFVGLLALVRLSFVAFDERARAFFNALTFWGIIAFVVYTLGGDKNPARVVVIVTPLALIAGWFIGDWLERVARETDREFFIAQEIPVLIFALVISAFLYLVIVELATRGTLAITIVLARLFGWERVIGGTLDWQIVFALVLIALAAIAFLIVATVGWQRARTLAFALMLIVLTVWTVRQTAMLNYDAMRNAREFLVARAAASNVRDLERDLRDISRWRANDSYALHIVADEKLSPIVAWTVRDFRHARFAARPAGMAAQVLLLPTPAAAPSSDWMGQTYTLEMRRVSAPRTGLEWLRWLLFRDVGALERASVELWMRQPE